MAGELGARRLKFLKALKFEFSVPLQSSLSSCCNSGRIFMILFIHKCHVLV